jgi:hypothetical protein
MAIVTAWKYGDDGLFGLTLGATDRLAFSGGGEALPSPMSVDAWNPRTVVVDSVLAFLNSARNCRYVSPTQVSLEEAAAVALAPANVAQSDCQVKVEWKDDAVNTALSNCKFYAYNGVTASEAPAGCTVVAFERTADAIRKNRIGGDTTGKAWDAAYGCGGNGNALSLADQASSADHAFYLGISLKPTTYGQNSGIKFRVEFDVA